MASRISRRRFLASALAVGGMMAISSSVGGCTPKASPEAAPKEPQPTAAKPEAVAATGKERITIRVMNLGGPLGEYVYAACERFAEANPDILPKVEDVPYGEMSQKTEMGIAIGDLPDTLHAFTRWTQLGCYKGWYLPLDDLLDSTDAVPDYDDFYQISVENEKWEGKTYVLLESPCSAPNSTLVWNRNIFAAAGVEPPTPDMDIWDLFEKAQQVTNKQKKLFGIELAATTPARFAALCRTWGKPEYGAKGDTSTWLASPDGKEFNFIDNPGAIEFCTKFMRPLLDAGAQPTQADQIQGGLFVAGQSAMYQGHQGHPTRLELSIGENWDFHPEDAMNFPVGPLGRQGTAQESQVKCIYSGTKHPEEALRVLGYILSKESGLVSLEKTGNYSGRRSVYLEFADRYPHFRQWDELMMAGIVEPYPMPWNLRDLEVSDKYTNTMNPLLQATADWVSQAPVVQGEIQKIYDLPRP